MLLMNNIVIRSATAADTRALDRLAQLDSAAVPPAPHVLAFNEDRLVAALSTRDGAVIADPFERTADIVALLRRRARQIDNQVSARRLIGTLRLAH
jgi:hypothetical protein